MGKRPNNNTAFIMPLAPSRNAQSMSRSNRGWKMMGQTPKTGENVSRLKRAVEYAQANPEVVVKAVSTAKDIATGIKDSIPSFAGTSSNPNHSSGYALSAVRPPININLDSGIKPDMYSSEYMEAIENECSPLHMTSSVFTFPTSVTTKLYTYFNQEIVFMLQNRVQENVSFNLPMTDFTPALILSAFNALVYALQHYYYYQSIISYESMSYNKNQGMWFMRQQITANAIEGLTRLEKRLMETPCPPRLNEYLRYLMGNFYSSPSQGSPILKLNPGNANDNMINLGDIDAAIAGLASDANNKVYTLMRKAVPDWKLKSMYTVDPTPIYDANFVTIFANLPYSYFNGANVKVPTVATADTPIAYCSFSNVLDGLAYVTSGAYVTANTDFTPGLVAPPAGSNGATAGLTRRSYYNVGGVKKFYAPELQIYLKGCRAETYNTKEDNITVVARHLHGTDKCSGVTANTIHESCMKAIDYLMSWDTIVRAKQPSFNRIVKDSTAKRRRN